MCAAPGGKSILLQSLGFNVLAIDKSQNQINKFKENLNRLNIKINIQKLDFLKNKFTDKFNSILLDAPCSALGTFRRNPDVTVKIDPSQIKKHQKTQIQMLEKSLKILNNGGFLVYVVCSFHPFETIDVIDKIIQKHKKLKENEPSGEDAAAKLEAVKSLWNNNKLKEAGVTVDFSIIQGGFHGFEFIPHAQLSKKTRHGYFSALKKALF